MVYWILCVYSCGCGYYVCVVCDLVVWFIYDVVYVSVCLVVYICVWYVVCMCSVVCAYGLCVCCLVYWDLYCLSCLLFIHLKTFICCIIIMILASFHTPHTQPSYLFSVTLKRSSVWKKTKTKKLSLLCNGIIQTTCRDSLVTVTVFMHFTGSCANGLCVVSCLNRNCSCFDVGFGSFLLSCAPALVLLN